MKTSQTFSSEKGFTLIECMAAAVIFAIVFTGLYLTSSRVVFALDAARQSARATDIAIANIEYLRTRSWDQLIAMQSTTPSSTNIISENLIVSKDDPSSILSYIELHPQDPQNIFLTGLADSPPSRSILMEFFPSGLEVNPTNGNAPTNTIIKATVMIAYVNVNGRATTNTMTTFITEGGLSASTANLEQDDVNLLNLLTGFQ